MRAYRFLGLWVMLGACTSSPSPTPDVSGLWEDDAAAFTTCGETFPVAAQLELSQTGSNLQGTFTLQGVPSAFNGEMNAGEIIGTVRSGDGSLEAALSLEGERLAGTFTAAEEIDCTADGSSTTVYKVMLERR